MKNAIYGKWLEEQVQKTKDLGDKGLFTEQFIEGVLFAYLSATQEFEKQMEAPDKSMEFIEFSMEAIMDSTYEVLEDEFDFENLDILIFQLSLMVTINEKYGSGFDG